MEVKLPGPALIVLVGASSSGKTTWAREHFAGGEIVSSDSLRAMVGAGEDDQSASTAAFDLLERIVDERMRRGLTTVIDTTGLDAEARRRWTAKGHGAGMPVHAVVFGTSPEVCRERNAARQRPIPKTVLDRQLSRLKRVADEMEGEDFDGVHPNRPMAMVTPVVATIAGEGDHRPPPKHTFGLTVSRFNWPEGERGEQLASVARRAEAAGFRDLWVMDHLRQIRGVGRPWEDMPEAYTTLGFVAGVTGKIRLGVLVTGITHRPPVLMGKMVATLDVLSGGRAICGLGAAWDQAEHTAYGIDFPDLSTRYALLEETLQMLPLLWGKGTPSFHGAHIDTPELICYPRPVQDPVPILIGGSGEKRTLRLAARYADACNLFGDPATVAHKTQVLAGHCAEFERDPAEVEVTHLVTALVATDRKKLRARVDRLRDRNATAERFMKGTNAGTVDDLVELFSAYSAAGAGHSILSMPDVALEDSIETFADVIARFDSP
ncbi:MAG: TIGR03560 family F420-dependent LLM class oxidoreductase [Acidimicrobiia bacterium]